MIVGNRLAHALIGIVALARLPSDDLPVFERGQNLHGQGFFQREKFLKLFDTDRCFIVTIGDRVQHVPDQLIIHNHVALLIEPDRVAGPGVFLDGGRCRRGVGALRRRVRAVRTLAG